MPGYAEKARSLYLETGTTVPESIVKAQALIKWAMARANAEEGLLPRDVADAIAEEALRLAQDPGRVVVEVFMTGSGTGLNMAVNDAIASAASKRLGKKIHPNDHVNLGQSSNDTVPTAIRIAAGLGLLDVLTELRKLESRLEGLARRWNSIVKAGRTHLRDALPVTLGQWARSYLHELATIREALERSLHDISLVPLSGTAVGTGVNGSQRAAERAVRLLAERTGLPLRRTEPPGARMRLLLDLHRLASLYKNLALLLWRLMQDVRLMQSGPVNGLNEAEIRIDLPGSSMMPGKTNPVTAESVMQAAAHVAGLEGTVEKAMLLGELELSMGIPLAGYALVEAATILREALRKAGDELERLEPRREEMRRQALRSPALATLLAPVVGYDKAAEIAKAMIQGASLEEAAEQAGVEPGLLKGLSPEEFVKPGFPLGRRRLA